MPTTYTHYAYGQEVFHKLPEELQRKIEPYIEYYNIGVHGPDILFYYHSYCKNKVNQYGVKVHHEPAREFFKRAFRVFQARLFTLIRTISICMSLAIRFVLS